MNIAAGVCAGLLLFATATSVGTCQSAKQGGEVKTLPVQENAKARITLPPPDRTGRMTLEQALVRRRSAREFATQAHRLSVVTVELPPLRERREDIPLLAQYFLKQFAARYSISALTSPMMRWRSSCSTTGPAMFVNCKT